MRAAVDAWGRVDVLINNAGTVDDAPFDDMTADRFEPLIDVHLKGAFFVTRPAWQVMRARGYGRIVNTTSSAGILGSPRMSNYGSAKTGLIGFTRVLAAEGAELGIKVNAVAPIANTRMLERSMASVAELADAEALAAAQDVMRPFFDKVDPALGVARGGVTRPCRLPGDWRDLYRWRRPGFAVLHRAHPGLPQSGAVGGGRGGEHGHHPRRDGLHRARGARRRDGRVVRGDHAWLARYACSNPMGSASASVS